MTLDEFTETLDEHELAGVQSGRVRCSCGGGGVTFLDHVADLIWAAFPGKDQDAERRSALHVARRTDTRPRGRIDLDRTRRVLEREQARQERLGRRAARMRFSSFADEADWFIAQDPFWHRRHGWPVHPFTIERTAS